MVDGEELLGVPSCVHLLSCICLHLLLFDVLVEGGAGHSSCFHGVFTTSMLYVHYHVVQWQIEGVGFQ